MNDAEVAAFNENHRRKLAERARVYELVVKYQKTMPVITAKWDTSMNSVDHNDIHSDLLKAGVSIFDCSMADLLQGIFDAGVYDANTLWSETHDSRKIAKVIEAWESGQPLSPILLSRHLARDLAVVSDGKHRLTVSRAIQAAEMPFMVLGECPTWVSKAFPGAKQIL